MSFLVDTHAYLWWLQDSDQLPASVREILADPNQRLRWSAASTWEMAIKLRLDKLRLPDGKTLRDFTARLSEDALTILPVQQAHAVEVATLPSLHRDPFDRMLIAQARTEKLVILTGDEAIAAYDVETRWA